MSVWKLYEQLFDLNIGQFWYAPILFISSFVLIIWKSVKREWLYPLATLLFTITAFFYQTNPGWHYGTSGYGPGRHGLLFLPLVIFFTFQVLRKMSVKTFLLLLIIAGVQLGILSTNNFLEPDLTKTLHHSVFAKSVLNTYPQFYNPTPEIFQDRTNHTDITFPTTAIYRNSEGKCIKAYVLQSDIEAVKDECGSFIEPDSIFENEFIRIANYPRKVVTSQATFWPYSDACAEWFVPTADKNFSCPQTLGEFMVQTGIQNPDLISTVPEFPYPGIWKINSDQPILITVPAGYIIHHNSFDGVYVHF